MPNKNEFTKQEEVREFLIDEIKKHTIGPLNGHFYKDIPVFQFNPKEPNKHRQEIVKDPRNLYLAGILYPQGQKNIDEKFDEDLDNTEEESSSDIQSQNRIKESDKSEGEDDSVDNNNDIDLVNEMKPSAMGMSIQVLLEDSVVVGIKDMGIYDKYKDIDEDLIFISLYLARFSKNNDSYNWLIDNFKLTKKTQSECHIFLSNFFDCPPHKIKRNYRDYFDKFWENRVGFYKTKNTFLDKFKIKYDKLSKKDFEDKILEIINNPKKTTKDDGTEIDTEKKKVDAYFRESISGSVVFSPNELKDYERIEKSLDGFNDNLKISIVTRPIKNNTNKKYLTISILNNNKIANERIITSKCFFQSNFYVESKNDKNIFEPFEDANLKDLNEEELSLHLLHHKRRSYGIGHGCSIKWDIKNQHCKKIYTSIIPVYEVKPIKPTQRSNLNMKLFSEDINFALKELKNLLNDYDQWLNSQDKNAEDFNKYFKIASSKNITKAKTVLSRMREGFKILSDNKNIQKAFQLMNKSMYMQQIHYLIPKNFFTNSINYDELFNQSEFSSKGNWYPFQIAFILLNIKSLHQPDSDDRNIMDLIWFPTGGGKTEAYLGLTAFTIFLRKINKTDIRGCAVIMRYTLRLLTTQQFQRAASLICACEYIRRKNVNELGEEPISIGLWVGMEVSPNKLDDAKETLASLLQSPNNSNHNKFVLLNCPWCMQELAPIKNSNGRSSSTGYRFLNKTFKFVCPNSNCNFSHISEPLPIMVVDEQIYKTPPTLLLGTIDKFASLPWEEKAISMINKEGYSSPDLIIQDEMHLISGPLGSVAGMYEIFINALTGKTIKDKTIYAKIIGSTATISRAETQIKNLYARESNIFPPQVNSLEDSFFSYEDNEAVGRKYVGVFCPSATSPLITQAKIISTMCLSVNDVKATHNDTPNQYKLYDPYWTHLIYFNSIRELMSGSSLINQDVWGNINGEYIRKGNTKQFLGDDYSKFRRSIHTTKELTSRVAGTEIPEILSDLFIEASEKKTVDLCMATNMIQVGIDIPRLGLMSIIGQPKTTSEYIQASSRVGRKYPGLVLNLLSPFRPRDRSHYEKFHSYHQNLYKFVEPTSITSNSHAVRIRCLPAIVIGLSRLWGDVQRINPTVPEQKLKEKITKYILEYVDKSDKEHPEEVINTKNAINYIFDKWESMSPQNYGKMSSNEKSVLMIAAGKEKAPEGNPFQLLTSMRNVDKECQAEIIKEYLGVR